MAYIPVKVITVNRNRLQESGDLTKPMSDFLDINSYLVIKQDTFTYTLSIGEILTFVPNIDLSQPIGQAFNNLFNDSFISHFENNIIPLVRSSGLYQNRLRVLNPFAYKDYKVQFTSVDTPTVIDDVEKKGFLDDLVITSSQDLSQCLVAVNGVFHRTVFANDSLYVLDGFRTIRLTGRKDVTLVDTRDIGGHTIVPLTANNVEQGAYKQNAIVNLQNSIANKTVFAVIDGYFYHRDHEILEVATPTHLRIKTNKLPLIQQFRHNPRTLHRVNLYGDSEQHSRKYEDPYDLIFLGRRSVSAASLENAAFQYSRLTSYHSFLVVINNPNIFTVSADIIPTDTPQFYYEQSNRNISGMLNYGCGLCPSYLIWKDPAGRKSIFLQEQDYDVDHHNRSIDPAFIPAPIREPRLGAKIPAQFIDYVSA